MTAGKGREVAMGAGALGGVCCVILLVAIAGGIGVVFASWRGALELGGLVLAVVAAVSLLRARGLARGR
jgi:hypothetical protein